MQNKNGIIALTVIVSLLCAYYLSFTFVSQKIQGQADAFATTDKGLDYAKRQKYLDSMGKVNVYNLGFANFTYNQVKNNELHLGLDLQGGMHVVLEVSPVEILKGLANNTDDANFAKAIAAAQERQKTSTAQFTTLFFEEYEKIAGVGKLSVVFANSSNQGRIDVKTPETQIKTIIQSEVDGAIDRAYNIIKTRIDKFGTTQPNVQRIPNTSRIQVELPGVDNPERVRKLLQGVAKLEFWEVYEAKDYIQYIQKANDFLVKRQKASALLTGDSTVPQAVKDTVKALATNDTTKKADSAKNNLADQLKKDGKTIGDTSKQADPKDVSPLFAKLASPRELVYEAGDTAQINTLINDREVRNLIPQNMVFAWEAKANFEDKEKGKSYYTLYVLKKSKNGKASLGGEVIEDARGDLDRINGGKPYVSMQMNPEGARLWKKLTGANINNRIAIVLDGLVYSAPVVQSEIGGGNSQISGNFTIEEAQDLSNILKAGKLPAPTRIVEEAVVGPSLGKESINQGLISTLVGLALVIGFMVFYYAQGGVVANVALSFNIFFLIGIMAQLGSALTLPGIAGIVLTFGMAVDANVLIYERVREELKNGKSIIEALELGYEKAFASIFDSNVTTLLTGVILLLFGSGPIKGFAVTLVIGILISFFTAVYVSKVIIFWWAKNYPNSMKFGNSWTNNFATGTNYDFISKGKRKMAYTVSIAIIALGIIAIVVKGGMNLGVDFKGGRTYIVEFKDAVVASDIKDKLVDNFENKGTEVKTYNSNNKIKVTTTYLIEEETEEADKKVQAALETGLKDFASNEPKIVSTSKVGSTIADDIRNSAWQATLAALLGIFLYIVVRFQRWQFGLGAVIAELHDVLVVIAIYAIAGLVGFNFEVDQVFVAAILTIVGYSINDKVVVFDRIREFMNKRMEGDEIEKTLNASVNDTLSRTLITAVASLLVLFVMMIFGGQTLQGFCFSMIIGIVFGTYSSIYVSTAIVADTLEKYGKADEKPVTAEVPKV
jgi:SecD/SecF fusion protein